MYNKEIKLYSQKKENKKKEKEKENINNGFKCLD
jgi:hypothetical protein